MKAVEGKPYLYAAVWKEREGWCYKIERRGMSHGVWSGSGFATREAAQGIMEERIKSIGG